MLYEVPETVDRGSCDCHRRGRKLHRRCQATFLDSQVRHLQDDLKGEEDGDLRPTRNRSSLRSRKRHGKIPMLSHLQGRITLSWFLAKET
jgi:hypothetical protein